MAFKNIVLALLVIIPVLCNCSNAATTWTGNADSNWSQSNNWSSGVPAAGSVVYIDEYVSGNPVLQFPVISSNAGSIYVLAMSVSYAGTSELTIENDANLEVTGFVRIGHKYGSNGIITVESGYLKTYTLHVGFNSQAENAAGNGRLYINGGVVECSDLGFGEDFPDFTWGKATGIIDISGGQLRVKNNAIANIKNKIANEQIIAFGGTGTLVYDYDHTTAGYTTVIGLPPVRELRSDTWVATDAVGRELPDYNEVGPRREGKFVGIFYWPWHYETAAGPYDITEIINANPTNPQWGDLTRNHHWGRPELGYYDSADPYVISKHASMLSDAGVDVIIFDTTNSPYTWYNRYIPICKQFEQIRLSGGRTPQIAFMAPFGDPRVVVQALYSELYQPGLYKNLWFQWDGKPLIMANRGWFTGNADIYDFFTFRTPVPSYFTGPSGSNQWGWLEVYPQHAFYDAGGSLEQVTVGVAQNAILTDHGPDIAFMSHNSGAMGRSWHDGSKDNDPDAVNYGYNFSEQWTRALSLDPEFVFITGWNEWIAMRLYTWAIYSAATESYYTDALFVDEYDQEYSRDIEPMAGGHTDNYYYQMVDNIRRFKGVESLPGFEDASAMSVDGDFSDWNNIVSDFRDMVGDTIHRDYPGYGSTYYTNNTGRNDIIETKVAFDAYKIYFYAQTADVLTSHTGSHWMMLFIDADQNTATGWEGYDYMINRYRTDTVATLERCVGGWNWEIIDNLPYSYVGDQLEIAVPRSLITQDNCENIAFDFHWADNIQNEGDIVEFAISGDSAPNRRFNYRYKKLTPAEYFQEDGNFEGWAMTHNLVNGVVAGGILSCDLNGDDAYMINGNLLNVDSQIYGYIHIRMKNESASTAAQFFWTTNLSTSMDNNKHVDFNILANDATFKDYFINVSDHSYWKDNIGHIRLDPGNATTGHVEIDFIRLQDRLPECGDFGHDISDLNHDCVVNSFDLSIVGKQWCDSSSDYKVSDMHHDGVVDKLDLFVIAGRWLTDVMNIE